MVLDIFIRDVDNIIRQNARGGLPNSYTIAQIQVTCENRSELDQLLQAMQRWANNTFEDVVISRPADPEKPTVVSKAPEVKVDIDPFTGMPI